MLSETIIEKYKLDPKIKVDINDSLFHLTPMTIQDLECEQSIELLSLWRQSSEHAFLKIFEVTNAGTLRWLKSAVILNKQRLMFWVVDSFGNKVGHIGVSGFNYEDKSCEIDNVIKSPDCLEKGIFTLTVRALIDWIEKELKPNKIKLRVFSENVKAISLYKRVGFMPVDIITFEKIVEKNYIEWIESEVNIDRCFLIMELFNDK